MLQRTTLNTVMSKSTVVIRKYGNRRLYDTSTSRYINLEQLAGMVRNGTDLKVVDAKSGEDLTHVTMTQIIVESAKQQPTSLPIELLRELIVASDHVGREFIAWYLRSAFDAYHKVHQNLQFGLSEARSAATSPIELLKKLLPTSSNAQHESNELRELRARVAELETKVSRGNKRPANPKRQRKPSLRRAKV